MEHTRDTITSALVNLLKTLPAVNAIWEGGAAGWKRVDEWSDIDLQADVADGYEQEILQQATDFLATTFGIEHQLDVPSMWAGMLHRFFKLNNCSPFLLVDLAIFKNSAPDKLLQPDMHGSFIVHHDPNGILKPTDLLLSNLHKKFRGRLPWLKTRHAMFSAFIEKEINRGNAAEAFSFYLAFAVQPAVEVWRMKHSPYHAEFGSRYLQYDLPGEIAEQLRDLYYVAGPEHLPRKFQQAQMLFTKGIETLENETWFSNNREQTA